MTNTESIKTVTTEDLGRNELYLDLLLEEEENDAIARGRRKRRRLCV
jgi:hypothetical protein